MHATYNELRAIFSKAVELREPYWKPACLTPQPFQSEK
jgi:hypothetical protein